MKKYSILIVDDEENVTRLLERVLAKEGYITYTAFDAFSAIDVIERNAIDAVLTDIKMPKISGLELLAKIKEIDPDIKVILMTAFATIDTAVEALRIGARDYITKPFNLDEVLTAVRNVTENIKSDRFEVETVKRDQTEISNYMITNSPPMKKVMEVIKKVADARSTVMLYGETGTGKELAAQTLHSLSERSNKPFIKVNCAAIPEQLLESELFGYEKGAFTGAVTSKPGRFELAEGGSIFLDEIGDISPSTQVKLLRVLQEKEFERLGGTKTIKADVRVIAATNKNLEEEIKYGKFREDLYYRLNVVPIYLPPLRERKDDIEMLVEHFLMRSSSISGRPPIVFSSEALKKLMEYNWPGNIRELENVVERGVVISSGKRIEVSDLPQRIAEHIEGYEDDHNVRLDDALDNAEKDMIIKALQECHGNKTKASVLLGISRRSLHRKILKYEIDD